MHLLFAPYNFSIFLGLLGVFAYSITFRSEAEKSHRIILGLIFFVLCFESYAYYLYSQGKSTWTLYTVCYVYLETLILFLYFHHISPSPFLKKYTRMFPFVLLGFGAVNTLFWQNPFEEFQSYSFIVASTGILVFCCLYLTEVVRFNHYRGIYLLSIPHFWNVSALLVFYSTNFIHVLSITYILASGSENHLIGFLYSLNRFFAGFMYIALGFSFYLSRVFKTSHAG